MAIEIYMPSLDPSITSSRVVKWLKNEGDTVAVGDALVEIETDKAVVEVEAEEAGVFGKVLVAGGDYADVNSVIGLLLEDGESADSISSYSPEQAAAEVQDSLSPETVVEESVDAVLPGVASTDSRRLFASPLARRLANLDNLDLSEIDGSGPNGRIIKRDIEAAQSTAASAPAANIQAPVAVSQAAADIDLQFLPDYETVELTGMRKTIARRLTESSQQIPHYFLSIDCELDQLLAQRKQLNAGLSPEDKISLNDFVIRAVALTMKKVPNSNVMWNEDTVLRFKEVDISVAVAVDGGLITPVVRKACSKGLSEISAETKNLASKARDGKLLPEEFQGGIFTISNLGMHGIKNFTSIINPPQSGILSVGAGEQRAVVKDGELTVATVMTVTLAADHRCVDGAIGSEFLSTFKGLMEAPLTMLL